MQLCVTDAFYHFPPPFASAIVWYARFCHKYAISFGLKKAAEKEAQKEGEIAATSGEIVPDIL